MDDVNGVGGISHNDAIGSIRDLGYGHDYCRWWRIIFDLFDFAKSMTINVIVFNGTEDDQIGWLLGITHLVPNNNNNNHHHFHYSIEPMTIRVNMMDNNNNNEWAIEYRAIGL